MTRTLPSDPIAAVTHPDPYPYYADLVARKPIYRDETLGLWVASSAQAVSAVLASDICRVRPLTEPVPRSLLGSPAAEIFRDLVRMNDGEHHHSFKQVVSATLRSLDAQTVLAQSRKWARLLLEARQDSTSHLQDFAFHLPIYVIASLLGVPQEQLQQTARWMSAFVPALAPASTPEQVQAGKEAAGHLSALCHALLVTQQSEQTTSLLTRLAWEAKQTGQKRTEVIIANGIGFLFQAYDATAGLLGNTMVTLATYPDIFAQVTGDLHLLPLALEEVLRYDPPVQNTRRFLAANGRVAEQDMQAGESVLVVLAAANRDPALNPRPERFELARKERRHFTFGTAFHTCPGATLAGTIAFAGLEQLLASGVQPADLVAPIVYKPAANVRIALLHTK